MQWLLLDIFGSRRVAAFKGRMRFERRMSKLECMDCNPTPLIIPDRFAVYSSAWD